ncbi:MAG: phosphodiester glycosidase family protein, partial [Bacteroidota bacterium]
SNFKMTGFVIAKNGDTLHLASVNRRRDTADRCLYNRFAGDTIPRIRGSDIRDKLAEALADTSYRDITDTELDTAALRDEIIKIERESSAEFANAKARLIYIDRPGVNKRIRCRVAKIDTGSHSTEGGCLISAGASGFPAAMLAPGDTVIVEFRTNELSNIEFRESVCGTPRLVRNGRAEHEAQTEGSTGRRFIRHALPRSAIGANRARSKIYLVAVEGNSRSRQTRGASLADMARIMHALGAYDAINLDGGGSTSMVIDNKNVASPLRPDAGRSISVGLGLILRNPPNLKNFFQK